MKGGAKQERGASEEGATANYAGSGHICGWPRGSARSPGRRTLVLQYWDRQ